MPMIFDNGENDVLTQIVRGANQAFPNVLAALQYKRGVAQDEAAAKRAQSYDARQARNDEESYALRSQALGLQQRESERQDEALRMQQAQEEDRIATREAERRASEKIMRATHGYPGDSATSGPPTPESMTGSASESMRSAMDQDFYRSSPQFQHAALSQAAAADEMANKEESYKLFQKAMQGLSQPQQAQDGTSGPPALGIDPNMAAALEATARGGAPEKALHELMQLHKTQAAGVADQNQRQYYTALGQEFIGEKEMEYAQAVKAGLDEDTLIEMGDQLAEARQEQSILETSPILQGSSATRQLHRVVSALRKPAASRSKTTTKTFSQMSPEDKAFEVWKSEKRDKYDENGFKIGTEPQDHARLMELQKLFSPQQAAQGSHPADGPTQGPLKGVPLDKVGDALGAAGIDDARQIEELLRASFTPQQALQAAQAGAPTPTADIKRQNQSVARDRWRPYIQQVLNAGADGKAKAAALDALRARVEEVKKSSGISHYEEGMLDAVLDPEGQKRRQNSALDKLYQEGGGGI